MDEFFEILMKLGLPALLFILSIFTNKNNKNKNKKTQENRHRLDTTKHKPVSIPSVSSIPPVSTISSREEYRSGDRVNTLEAIKEKQYSHPEEYNIKEAVMDTNLEIKQGTTKEQEYKQMSHELTAKKGIGNSIKDIENKSETVNLSMNFSKDEILKGIIFSEIINKPKSLRR